LGHHQQGTEKSLFHACYYYFTGLVAFVMLPEFASSTLWWHGTVVERRSLAGELSLSCARPAADE